MVSDSELSEEVYSSYEGSDFENDSQLKNNKANIKNKAAVIKKVSSGYNDAHVHI